MLHSPLSPLTGAYAGYVSNPHELLSCTSGGIATALGRHMLSLGGYVAGVSYSEDFYTARYEIIRDETGLEKLKGSKYIEVKKGSIYRDVRTLLEENKQVLFFGLPCAIAALNASLGREYPNLVTAALICHGPTYAEVHRQFVAHLEQTFGTTVADFTVRRKAEGWTPAYLQARFADGQVYQEKFDATPYGHAFRLLSKKGCYTCPFRKQPRQWDLTIGDFWGAEETDPCWNRDGVSAILTHTQRGLTFLMETPDIRLFEASPERIVEGNPCLVQDRCPKPQREAFLRLLRQQGLWEASRQLR